MNQNDEPKDLGELRKLIDVNVRLLATAQENLDKINRILAKREFEQTPSEPPQEGQNSV